MYIVKIYKHQVKIRNNRRHITKPVEYKTFKSLDSANEFIDSLSSVYPQVSSTGNKITKFQFSELYEGLETR